MSKNLVLFFSVYESTKAVAQEIAAQTGADIVEIEPVTPYDGNRNHYNALARYAKKEHDDDMRPAIKNEIDIDTPFLISTTFRKKQSSRSILIWVQVTEAHTARLQNLNLTRLSSKAYQSKCRKRNEVVKIK